MVTPQQLAKYATGRCTAEEQRSIEEAAKTDGAFRARLIKLNAWRVKLPTDAPPAPDEPVSPAGSGTPGKKPSVKKVVAVVGGTILAAVLLSTAGIAGYQANTRPPEKVVVTETKEVRVEVPVPLTFAVAPAPRPIVPLLEDDFTDEKFDNDKWALDRGRPGRRAMDGYVRLRDRGSLVTLKAFNEPIQLRFDWTWLDWAEDPLYSENLNVVLHTTGHHQPVRSFEIKDGLSLSFSTIAARVLVDVAEPSEVPDRTKFRRLNQSPAKATVFAADKRYHIRITDTGKKVAVFVSGGKIDPKYAMNPVVEVEYNEKFADHHIAIYNREFVGGARHESHISNFSVRRLPE